MPSVLYSLKNNVSEHAEIISEVIGVDVEIIDNELIRVAGTGDKKKLVDIYMEDEGHICKHVLKNKKKLVVEKPGLHRVCLENCISKKKCDLSFVVSNPIILGDEAIGAINLLCFTEKQKIVVKKNLEMYSNFFENISRLIAAEAGMVEMIEINQSIVNEYVHVLDTINNGIIIFDNNGKVKYLNKKAGEILDIRLEYVKGIYLEDFIFISDLEEEENIILNEEKEYYIGYDGRTKLVIGIYSPIFTDRDSVGYIFNFSEKTEETSISPVKEDVRDNKYLDRFIGEDYKVLEMKDKIKNFAKTDSTVLITGESGTGKELVAKALHFESNRKDYPFVVVNCASIPETLLESELFGYVKGAFTGANNRGKVGKFELANNGTIFLDEIGEMPLKLQAKLLRVLQNKTIQRIGSNETIKLDVKIISATNRDLETLVEEGKFREDLYFRLCVIPIEIPPLRKRKEDIELLINYFIRQYSHNMGKTDFSIDDNTMEKLVEYHWPGNVRELENTIEYLANIANSGDVVTIDMLPKRIKGKLNFTEEEKVNVDSFIISNDINDERQKLLNLLHKYGDSVKGKKIIAKNLNMSLSTLYRKIDKYNIKKVYK